MTEEGEQVESYLAAIKIIEARPEFGKEDVERVNEMIGQHTETWKTVNEIKLDDDLSSKVKPKEADSKNEEERKPVMPDGWRVRICGSQQYIVSPEGEQFQSRRKALQHLVGRGAERGTVA